MKNISRITKRPNQKYMSRAFDHSSQALDMNHYNIAPDLLSRRRSFYLNLVAKNRQVDKMNKKLKKKIAFSRVEPGSNLFFEQTRTTTTRRLAWKEACRFLNLARTFKCRIPAINIYKYKKLDFNFFQRNLFR
jgi:hypothetical protein